MPPTYSHLTSFGEVSWGIGLIVASMIVHAVAMPMTISASHRVHQRFRGGETFWSGVVVLLIASLMIVTTHLLEVCVWAGFFWGKDAFPTLPDAYYFSLLQFTTVGSQLQLPNQWRLLGGMIAMAGLLTFAWSTTVLLALAQRFQDAELRRIRARQGAPADS